jgi:nuclease-like protein
VRVPESSAERSADALKLRCRGADLLAMGIEAPGNRLRLREPDRCVVCGEELAAGDQAIWDPVSRTVTCASCHPDVPVVEGKAGASARREYQRRHERREQHARKRLGGLGTVLARVIDEPQSTTNWQQGARGEERTAARLAKHLEGHDVKVLHDRRVPGHGQANIDHLVVGPGGVTVIDTKTHKGEIRVDRVGALFSDRRSILLIGGRDRTSLIDGLERQIQIVRSALARGGAQDVEVGGALCFPNPDGLPLFKKLTIRDIAIDGTKPVAKLARRAGPLDRRSRTGRLASERVAERDALLNLARSSSAGSWGARRIAAVTPSGRDLRSPRLTASFGGRFPGRGRAGLIDESQPCMPGAPRNPLLGWRPTTARVMPTRRKGGLRCMCVSSGLPM